MSGLTSLVEQLDAQSLIPYQYEAFIPLIFVVLCFFVVSLVKEDYTASAILLPLGVYIIFAMCQPMGSFHYWIAVLLRLIFCVYGIMFTYDEFNKNGRLDGWDIAYVWFSTNPIVWIMDLAIISGVSHPALVWIWSTRHGINIGIGGEMVVPLCLTIFGIVQLLVQKEFTSLFLAPLIIAIIYLYKMYKIENGSRRKESGQAKKVVKWKGFKDHLEKLIKEKSITFRPADGGFEEFASRVERGLIEPGYIIYMPRRFDETLLGLFLTNYMKISIDRKYVFAHASIYVGKWDGIYYFVENGGTHTGKAFLSYKEMGRGYSSAIQLVNAKEVISDSPFMAMTIPWSYDPKDNDRKKWPTREEVVQKALASVGFPFNYKLRTCSCETFIMLLIGIGDMDSDEVFPQIPIVLNDDSWLKKFFVGSDEITENDRIEVEQFRARFDRWLCDKRDAIDNCAFTVENGKTALLSSYENAPSESYVNRTMTKQPYDISKKQDDLTISGSFALARASQNATEETTPEKLWGIKKEEMKKEQEREKDQLENIGQDEIFTSQAKHPNFSKLTQLEGSSIDRSADDTSLSSNSLNASSDGVLSNTNDPSCGYDSFWQELSLLDPTANRYTTRNINMKSLSKEWKYILRRLFPNDADGWIHSIQEIFGIEDMNHKMFTTFSILKKSIASGQLSIKLLDDKLYPILEKAKKKSQDESLQVVPGSPSSLHEYSADEILIKHHTTLIKKLLPNLAIPIINALHKLYETDEKKAIATQFILNRFCARKYVCLEAIEEAKDFLRRYDCNLLNHNRNFAFANLYQPTYDVIIDRDLPENLKDKETLKKEITHTLNGIKTNKRLRDWLIKIHDERSSLYGWEKIEGTLTEEDFQLVSFEVLDIFYGNKVHFTFKFIAFKMEEPNQDDRCRLEKLNNVYRIALENIGNIMTNSNSIRFENNTIHISINPEMETNIETIVLDQLRDVWGRACTDESYRDKLLNKLQEKFHNIDIPYNTSEDILSLFKNENYIDLDVDRLQIEFKKDGGDAKATLVNGYVLWPKMTRRLSELPNEWFSEFYGIFMQVIPEKFYKSIARTFICNASIYKKGENCSILMEEALNFKSENNLLGLFNHFRKNGGTVGELRLAIQECNTDDINLESQLNKEKITYIGILIENIDFLIEDTYKKWKSRFETKLPGKITTRKVFENFFKQYGVSQMPKMNVSEFYQKIESGEIHKGDQIWFWRYRFSTDSYAHVGIFVDEESITDSNQVRDDLPPQKSIVHVTPRERAKLRHISRQEQSRIKCDSVQDAVHTNDEIFVVRYEGNADFSGEEIAKRALACCKPKITFNYNGHYGSCETFASKICGSTSVENLNLQGFQVAFEGGKKEVIANLLHREERFDDLIRQVDSRMMTLSRDSAEPLES